jgi:hypothetical protein
MSSDQGQFLPIAFVQFLAGLTLGGARAIVAGGFQMKTSADAGLSVALDTVVATTGRFELVMHAGLHHPEPNFRAESCSILLNLLDEEQYVDKVIAYDDILPTLIKLTKVKAFAATAR